MRRRTTSLLLFLLTLVVLSFLWPSSIEGKPGKERLSYPPPRLVKNNPEGFIRYDGPRLALNVSLAGWRPFSPPDSHLLPPFVMEPTLAQQLPCVDEWISQGKICKSKAQGKIDVVWTWINGSEPVLATTRDDAMTAHMKKMNRPKWSWGILSPAVKTGARLSHFRTHGELLNSMRSILKSLPAELVRRYILVTADIPADDTADLRLGSVPTWLDLDQAVEIRHHSDIFRVPTSLLNSTVELEPQARAWRDQVVPSFNSLAIESQFPNLETLAPTLFYLNDDCFILKPLAAADLETSLYGPVFRIQFDLAVKSTAPGALLAGRLDKEGEWPGLQYTNWLLDQRFGNRKRRYLAHVAKVMPTPLMREAAAVWADELARTAEAQFRGQGSQVNLQYLVTWYTIEKHREALLHSFIMLRVDANADGLLSPDERRTLTDGLESGKVTIAPRNDRTMEHINRNLKNAGLTPPKETTYDWLSSYGYPIITTVKTDTLVHCTISIEHCFASNSILEVFKRVTFEHPDCGDCLIAHIIAKSGPHGLNAFLPPANSPSAVHHNMSLAKEWQHANFPSGMGREFAVDSIHRYSYVAGSSPSSFMSLRRASDTLRLPNKTSPVAFLAVNDDLGIESSVIADRVIHGWFTERWGNIRGWWEKS